MDYPNSRKARKMYLCLMVGQQEIPKGLDGEEMGVGDKARLKEEVRNETRRRKDKTTGGKKKKGKTDISAKDWVLKKKALYRVRGKEGYVVMPTDPLHAGADIAVCLRTPSSRRESEGFSFDLWQGRYFRFHFITILCMHLTTLGGVERVINDHTAGSTRDLWPLGIPWKSVLPSQPTA